MFFELKSKITVNYNNKPSECYTDILSVVNKFLEYKYQFNYCNVIDINRPEDINVVYNICGTDNDYFILKYFSELYYKTLNYIDLKNEYSFDFYYDIDKYNINLESIKIEFYYDYKIERC